MAAESPRLAVIGAGIAGLTAARLWQDRGLSVRLFDKGRNIGGRCATRRRDELAFDHGAPAIAATDGDFRWAMRRWMMGAALQRWLGSMQGFPEGLRLFTGTPDMNAIPVRLGAGLDIAQRVEVARIEREPDGGWHLHDADGTALGRFDAVLLTCPPAQAQRLLQPGLNAGWVEPGWFDRPVQMRAVWTVMAAFESRVASAHDAMALDGEPLEFALRNSSKPERTGGPESWVLHAAPDITEQFLDHPKEAVVEDFLAALAYHLDTSLPRVIFARAHRWLYARAEATDTPNPDGTATTEPSLFDPETGLGFAGDWLSPPASPFLGVQSAWLSGRHMGQRLRAWARSR